MNEHSPNWYWRKLGFNVVRSGAIGLWREIFDKNGKLVCANAGHDGELEIAERIYNQLNNRGDACQQQVFE